MNLPSFQFLQLVQPLSTTVSSPKLDLIVLTWEHIANRYLRRLESNRILAGRVRSIRLLAVHDAIQSVIDPGNGYIFKEISNGSSTVAASAAAVRAAHDVLAAVFDESSDRDGLAHLLEESLSLIGDAEDKPSGEVTGAASAAAYLRIFAPLFVSKGLAESRTGAARPPLFSEANAGRPWPAEWRRSA